MNDDRPILALVRDLIFASKLSGPNVRVIRDPAQLGATPGRRLIVDLNLPGAIEAARVWKTSTGGEVVGFVSHVDTDTIDRARAACLDRVLARSRFVELLPELLSPL